MDFDELDSHADEERLRREAIIQQDERWQAFVSHRSEQVTRRRQAEARQTEVDRRWQLKEHAFLKKRDELFLGAKAEEGVRHAKEIGRRVQLEKGGLAEEVSSSCSSEAESDSADPTGSSESEEEEEEEPEEREEPAVAAAVAEDNEPEIVFVGAQDPQARQRGQEEGSETAGGRSPQPGAIVAFGGDHLLDARAAMARRQEERRRRRRERAEEEEESRRCSGTVEEHPPDAMTAKIWRMMERAQQSSRQAQRFLDGEEDREGRLALEDGDEDGEGSSGRPRGGGRGGEAETDEAPDLLMILNRVDKEDKEERELEAVQAFLPDLEMRGTLVVQEGEVEDPELERSIQRYQEFCPDVDVRSVVETHTESPAVAAGFEEAEGRCELLARRRREQQEKRSARAKERGGPRGPRRPVGVPPENLAVQGLWVPDWPGTSGMFSSSASSSQHWRSW